MAVRRLTKRPQYLAVASRGRKRATAGMVVQVSERSDSIQDGGPRYGITASRKVGNAVTRNRARRRLRAVAEAVLRAHPDLDLDIVLIARQATPTRPFAALVADFESALDRLVRQTVPHADIRRNGMR